MKYAVIDIETAVTEDGVTVPVEFGMVISGHAQIISNYRSFVKAEKIVRDRPPDFNTIDWERYDSESVPWSSVCADATGILSIHKPVWVGAWDASREETLLHEMAVKTASRFPVNKLVCIGSVCVVMADLLNRSPLGRGMSEYYSVFISPGFAPAHRALDDAAAESRLYWTIYRDLRNKLAGRIG